MTWWEPIFYACNYGVLVGWALLVFAPRWRWTHRVVSSALVPLSFGVAYMLVLFTNANGSPDGGYTDLEGVVAIFTSPQTVAAAWIHYLIFDLFVGAWIVRDAQRHTIPHLAVAPLLVLTLLFGPAGLLAYLLLRGAMRHTWTLEEPREPVSSEAS